MNQRIKEEWLKRLRSGEYEQGRTWLLYIDKDGSSRYCCLGVLCEIWWEETSPDAHREIPYNSGWAVHGDDGEIRFATLPETVVKWSGITDAFGILPDGKGTLVDLNDSGSTFQEIAQVIEEQL